MKKIKLKYGRKELEIEIPNHAKILTPETNPPQNDELELLTLSLDNPIDSPKLENFINPNDKVLIIVPDKTRKARIDFVLKILLERIRRSKIKILFANGTHAKQNEFEKIEILGDEIYNSFEIFEHDAYNGDFIYFGKTKRGTEIFLNKLVSEADKIILVGSITHHYFAGAGGGAKMLIPGVASYKTAIQNHKLTLTPDGDINPDATNLKFEGNPVYEDIIEAFKITGLKTLHLGVILDENDKICASFFGDVVSSHKEGVEFLKKFFAIKTKEKFDFVISSAGGFPKDVNFIQAHKSIHHSYYILKDGGTMFSFIECRDGIGSKTFLDWFKFKTIDEMKKHLLENYSMNGHTALSLRNKLKFANIIVKTELEVEILNMLGLKRIETFDQIKNLDGSIAVIPNASLYLTIYQGD
jgi:nickel-dependent lactate racemase